MMHLLIEGAGSQGRSVVEAVLAGEVFQLVGFVDDAAHGLHQVWDWPVFGSTSELANCRQHADAAIVAIYAKTFRDFWAPINADRKSAK